MSAQPSPFEALIAELIAANPSQLGALQADQILVVSAAARLSALASIRGFGGQHAPRITVRGQRQRYEISLRPLFFRKASPRKRLLTLCHELFHIGCAFDGHLDDKRRHQVMPEADLEKQSRLLAAAWEAEHPIASSVLAGPGSVGLWAWLVRPPGRLRPGERQDYDEADLFWVDQALA